MKNSKTIISRGPFVASPELVIDNLDEDSQGSEEAEGNELRQFLVADGHHGHRADVVLTAQIPEFSRSYLQQLVVAGLVAVNGVAMTKSSTRLRAGDRVVAELRSTPQTTAFKPEALSIDVVYEDAHLLVINKQAGLVVHPAPGNWGGTLLNGLLARDASVGNLPRAGIVHRLDKDTSGLMVVARTRRAMDELVQRIALREVRRQYLALGQGSWSGPTTRLVEASVGRDPRNRLRMAVVDLSRNAGKSASTVLRMIHSTDKYCLVECTLQTGRTHQIRVHMASIGHPLLGDLLYGGSHGGGISRQALHAFHLEFEHPITSEPLSFHSPLPADMRDAIELLGVRYNQAF